jgi:cation transport ATPase
MKQNLALALVYNVPGALARCEGAAVVSWWLMPPMSAALGMSLSSASALTYALPLRGAKHEGIGERNPRSTQ